MQHQDLKKIFFNLEFFNTKLFLTYKFTLIDAEVVTCARGLPGYPKSEINVLKTWQNFVALYFTQLLKMQGLKLYTEVLNFTQIIIHVLPY